MCVPPRATQIAGTAGKIVEYPFDTIKVRLQSQPTTPPLLYSGPWDCFRQSIQSHGAGGGGLRGLYRGLSAPLFGAAIETSSLFFSYRLAQTLWRSSGFLPPAPSSSSSSSSNSSSSTSDDNKNNHHHNDDHNKDRSRLPLGALVACGAASGAFTSLILTPIELVKCQMQVHPLSPPPPSHTTTSISRGPTAVVRPPGPLSIIAAIYRHHGPLGFWHGQLATCIRETGGSAAWFGVYEAVSALFRSRSSFSFPPYSSSSSTTPPLAIWQQMTSGACAGVSYIFGFFPADTIKSRMQTEAVVATPTTRGRSTKKIKFWECARIVWREQGLKGLYRGCGITVARAAPSSAFIFAIYEGLKGAF